MSSKNTAASSFRSKAFLFSNKGKHLNVEEEFTKRLGLSLIFLFSIGPPPVKECSPRAVTLVTKNYILRDLKHLVT